MTDRGRRRRANRRGRAGRSDRPRGAQGQILALFVGGMILIFLVAGLVIDGGTAFLNRRDAQNSADVAAMAGAKQLADYYLRKASLSVYDTIARSVEANGCGTGCMWTAHYVGARSGALFRDLGPVGAGGAPPGGALGVKVDVTRRPHTYFLGVVGQSTWTIDTTATAVTARPVRAPADELLPIAIWELSEFKTGTLYALTNGKNAPGNFGWLAWSGSNDSQSLAGSICAPNNPSFRMPASFAADPGKSNSSAVRDCLKIRVDSKQPVLIPIVDKEIGEGENTKYRIVAIAAFTITSFSEPAVDQINGRFEGTLPYSQGSTVPGGLTAPPSTESPFYYIGLSQ
jgi:putative Flp pilus-assembly TadE/G-like protein